MHAVMQRDDTCFYVRSTPGPPREHWVVIWPPGHEDRVNVAFTRWASNPALTFTDRDSCRARQDIWDAEWSLAVGMQDHRMCRWVEGICVGAFVVMLVAVLVRWLM